MEENDGGSPTGDKDGGSGGNGNGSSGSIPASELKGGVGKSGPLIQPAGE